MVGTKTSHYKGLSGDAKVLLALLHAEKPLTYIELAERAEVHRSTVYRVMPLLLARGIAEEWHPPVALYSVRDSTVFHPNLLR